MFFHNDAVPSSPQSIHALLRELAFIDEPKEFAANEVIVEESCAGEIHQVSVLPESSASPATTPETNASTHLLDEQHTIMRSEIQESWVPLRELYHRRRLTPPDLETIFEDFEDDSQGS